MSAIDDQSVTSEASQALAEAKAKLGEIMKLVVGALRCIDFADSQPDPEAHAREGLTNYLESINNQIAEITALLAK